MNAPAKSTQLQPVHLVRSPPDRSKLAQRLRRELQGEVLFDAASRGRYATDASIYQIEPVGVVVPRNENDALTALQIAIEEGDYVPFDKIVTSMGFARKCRHTVLFFQEGPRGPKS